MSKPTVPLPTCWSHVRACEDCKREGSASDIATDFHSCCFWQISVLRIQGEIGPLCALCGGLEKKTGGCQPGEIFVLIIPPLFVWMMHWTLMCMYTCLVCICSIWTGPLQVHKCGKRQRRSHEWAEGAHGLSLQCKRCLHAFCHVALPLLIPHLANVLSGLDWQLALKFVANVAVLTVVFSFECFSEIHIGFKHCVKVCRELDASTV